MVLFYDVRRDDLLLSLIQGHFAARPGYIIQSLLEIREHFHGFD